MTTYKVAPGKFITTLRGLSEPTGRCEGEPIGAGILRGGDAALEALLDRGYVVQKKEEPKVKEDSKPDPDPKTAPEASNPEPAPKVAQPKPKTPPKPGAVKK